MTSGLGLVIGDSFNGRDQSELESNPVKTFSWEMLVREKILSVVNKLNTRKIGLLYYVVYLL